MVQGTLFVNRLYRRTLLDRTVIGKFTCSSERPTRTLLDLHKLSRTITKVSLKHDHRWASTLVIVGSTQVPLGAVINHCRRFLQGEGMKAGALKAPILSNDS